MPPTRFIPQTLKELRLARQETIRHFGLTLKRLIDPKAARGFSHVYIMALETGKRPLTTELERAYSRLMALEDEADPDVAASRPAEVYATHDVTDCLVTGRVMECKRAGCKVRFVAHHPSQLYHSEWCRKQAKR